ncbi:MAG: hypothetical protein K2M17_02990 [Bacilli bacterium]|nr:hypothetical protein [Bacilli bacterium]
MNKYEIQVDDDIFIVDDISFEYSQQDGENAGRTDDGTMYRDVVGLINKVACDFKDMDKWKGATLSTLLKIVEKTSCFFSYCDPKENTKVTKPMYIISDKIKVYVLNDEYVAQPFQMRFTQMDVDDLG